MTPEEERMCNKVYASKKHRHHSFICTFAGDTGLSYFYFSNGQFRIGRYPRNLREVLNSNFIEICSLPNLLESYIKKVLTKKNGGESK